MSLRASLSGCCCAGGARWAIISGALSRAYDQLTEQRVLCHNAKAAKKILKQRRHQNSIRTMAGAALLPLKNMLRDIVTRCACMPLRARLIRYARGCGAGRTANIVISRTRVHLAARTRISSFTALQNLAQQHASLFSRERRILCCTCSRTLRMLTLRASLRATHAACLAADRIPGSAWRCARMATYRSVPAINICTLYLPLRHRVRYTAQRYTLL